MSFDSCPKKIRMLLFNEHFHDFNIWVIVKPDDGKMERESWHSFQKSYGR